MYWSRSTAVSLYSSFISALYYYNNTTAYCLQLLQAPSTTSAVYSMVPPFVGSVGFVLRPCIWEKAERGIFLGGRSGISRGAKACQRVVGKFDAGFHLTGNPVG